MSYWFNFLKDLNFFMHVFNHFVFIWFLFFRMMNFIDFRNSFLYFYGVVTISNLLFNLYVLLVCRQVMFAYCWVWKVDDILPKRLFIFVSLSDVSEVIFFYLISFFRRIFELFSFYFCFHYIYEFNPLKKYIPNLELFIKRIDFKLIGMQTFRVFS